MNKIIFGFLALILINSCAKKNDKIIEQKDVVQFIESPALINSAQPFLFSGDNMLLSWIENKGDSIYTLKYSTLENDKWRKSKDIATGNDWFVNWADFPAIAEQNGNLLSHFLQKSEEGTYTYDIKMKLFNKKDSLWEDDFILHNDGTKSEHGFVTMLPYKNDSFFVTWLDGRNTIGGHDNHGGGSMTVRAAEVQTNGSIINDVELDGKTCDCCQTSAAITSNGPIIVYRDRSDEEVRDIYIIRQIDSVWTKPKAVFNDNWIIEGCPVNGPKASVKGNSLAVAWFTEANKIPKVKLAFSKDGGATFDTPILIDEIKTIGRVDVVMIDSKNALVSWVSSNETETSIKVVKINSNGKKGTPIEVTKLNPSRASGFPQLEIRNDKAYFAWTDVSNEKSEVKTAFISLDDF